MLNYDFYLREHAEFSFKKWGFEADTNSVISPLGSQKIIIENLNWNAFRGKSHSELLWLYSLGAILKKYIIVNSKEDLEIIQKKIVEFLEFQTSKNNIYIYNSKYSYSYDHCAALRIKYLCMLSAKGYPDVDLINKIINNDLDWFLSLEKIPLNNHGMMLCESIFHATVFLYENKNRDELINKASFFLENVLNYIFPDNYYANENTIGYHDFYFKTLNNIINFLQDYSYSNSILERVKKIIIGVEDALYKVVWPNGGIPPIGQCGEYNTKYNSIQGSHLFKPQGFFVKKDSENYFSYICGLGTTIHKQVDDTSITLKLEGQDIFLDCGLGSYDSKDSRQVVINGQRGHSGAFFRFFDSFTMWEFFNSKKINDLSYSLEANDSLLKSLKSFRYKKHYYNINRNVSFVSFKEIELKDSFETSDIYAQPVTRFIIPFETEITQIENIIYLTIGFFEVKIICQDLFYFNILSSNMNCFSTSVAFQSKSYGKYNIIKVIEFTPLGKEMNFIINIKKIINE